MTVETVPCARGWSKEQPAASSVETSNDTWGMARVSVGARVRARVRAGVRVRAAWWGAWREVVCEGSGQSAFGVPRLGLGLG